MINEDLIIPAALVIGFIDNEDLRILEINNEIVIFESANLIEDNFSLLLTIFNLNIYGYEEFYIEKCKIESRKEKDFSYIYNTRLGSMPPDISLQYYQRVDELKTIIRDGVKDTDKLLHSKDKYSQFFNNYKEQETDWYSFELTNSDNMKFSNIISNIDLAFSIDNQQLYNQIAEENFYNVIDSILERNNLKTHGIFSKPFSRVYIGNEFCPCILPDCSLIKKIIDNVYRENINITISLPFLGENDIESTLSLLDYLDRMSSENKTKFEIVINDWGLINIILEKDLHFTPILGRLLNKRKKDPRFGWTFWWEKFKNEMESNHLNFIDFVEFLKSLGINRYEFESHGIKNKIPPGKHSMHFPFYQISTARFCNLYADCINNNYFKQKLVKECPQYCNEFIRLYPKHLKIVGKGNSTFGFDRNILINPDILSEYIMSGIDRLIYSI